MSEEYLSGIQQLKWGIEYSYSLIDKYKVGVLEILNNFADLFRKISYDGKSTISDDSPQGKLEYLIFKAFRLYKQPDTLAEALCNLVNSSEQ